MHIGQVINLLSAKERRKLVLVMLAAIFMATIEMVGVGSIMPFMTIAAKPESIHTNQFLQKAYHFFGFAKEINFLIFLGVIVLAFMLLSNVCQAMMQYIKIKFTSTCRHSLALRLMKAYLGQDYNFFLNRNSHEFVKNINSEVQQMINVTLMQFVELTSRLIQVLILTVFLFWVNPLSTLCIATAIVFIYGSIYVFTKKKLVSLGNDRFQCSSEEARIVSEVFWGIKEVKITGSENEFVRDFIPPSRRQAKVETVNEIIGDVPKFALETIAFSSIMIFVLFTLVHSGTFADVAGTITLYAYAGYRMIPAVQGLFKALTKLKYGVPAAKRLLMEFALAKSAEPLSVQKREALPYTRELTLSGIVFAYPGTNKDIFSDISLTIPANSLVGFAGKTGSGKTTLIDIILGLLHPKAGSFRTDGIAITKENVRNWQALLGYVPQSIYLSDNTIAANIAFGVSSRDIDMDAVRRAAKMAQIDEFIENELPQKYETSIGERGIRLSGGQRQRIGIARALYRNPSILIMDEATSALDGHTERAVMEAIDSLQGTRTIILIAHRLSTLKKCDTIYVMDKGTIVESGTYEQLEKTSPYFKSMSEKEAR